MEAAIEKYGPADRRLRIEHSQIMTSDDLARAARLGGMSKRFTTVRRCKF
jgi:predicted amidohydrolase YtcJ